MTYCDPTQAELEKLKKDAGLPHLPTSFTYQFRMAIGGGGPRAYDWSDKPHRLVYDLCRKIEADAAIERAMPTSLTVEQIKAEFETLHKLYQEDNLMWGDLEGLMHRITEGVPSENMPEPQNELLRDMAAFATRIEEQTQVSVEYALDDNPRLTPHVPTTMEICLSHYTDIIREMRERIARETEQSMLTPADPLAEALAYFKKQHRDHADGAKDPRWVTTREANMNTASRYYSAYHLLSEFAEQRRKQVSESIPDPAPMNTTPVVSQIEQELRDKLATAEQENEILRRYVGGYEHLIEKDLQDLREVSEQIMPSADGEQK